MELDQPVEDFVEFRGRIYGAHRFPRLRAWGHASTPEARPRAAILCWSRLIPSWKHPATLLEFLAGPVSSAGGH